VPSLTLGDWSITGSNTALHAWLSSAFLSLRQAVIASALGMSALQSLSTSGVHAMRCSNVPCEKEGTGEAIAGSNASDTHRTKAIGRSIRLFCISLLIGYLDAWLKPIAGIVIMADSNTPLPKFALVAKRLSLELSIPLQSFHFVRAHTNHQATTSFSKPREQHHANVSC
jgi:hypothetical protein